MSSRIGVIGGLGVLLALGRAGAAEPQLPSAPSASTAVPPPSAGPGAPVPTPVVPSAAPAENASAAPASAPPGALERETPGVPSLAPATASPTPAPAPAPGALVVGGPERRWRVDQRETPAALSPDSTAPADDGTLGDNQRHFSALAGVRSVVVIDSSYEPFAARNVLALFSVGATAVLAGQGPLSVALGAGWDIGGSSADVRGAETDILVQRFSVTPEARYHVSRRIYLLGRVGLGAGYVRATLEDQAAGDDRTARGFSFTTDLGVGLGVQLTSTKASYSRQPRLWVTADAGYLYDTGVVLGFGSSGADIPARSAPIELGKLSLSGPYGRLAAILAF